MSNIFETWQDFNGVQRVKKTSGEYIEIPYKDLCHMLEIIPEIQFLAVDKKGYITFTCGKPREVAYLSRQARDHGFEVSKDVRKALRYTL